MKSKQPSATSAFNGRAGISAQVIGAPPTPQLPLTKPTPTTTTTSPPLTVCGQGEDGGCSGASRDSPGARELTAPRVAALTLRACVPLSRSCLTTWPRRLPTRARTTVRTAAAAAQAAQAAAPGPSLQSGPPPWTARRGPGAGERRAVLCPGSSRPRGLSRNPTPGPLGYLSLGGIL